MEGYSTPVAEESADSDSAAQVHTNKRGPSKEGGHQRSRRQERPSSHSAREIQKNGIPAKSIYPHRDPHLANYMKTSRELSVTPADAPAPKSVSMLDAVMALPHNPYSHDILNLIRLAVTLPNDPVSNLLHCGYSWTDLLGSELEFENFLHLQRCVEREANGEVSHIEWTNTTLLIFTIQSGISESGRIQRRVRAEVVLLDRRR
jgi:hypothetical protein